MFIHRPPAVINSQTFPTSYNWDMLFINLQDSKKGVFLNLATTIPLLCIRLWRHAERWPPPTALDATVHFRRKQMTPFDCER